MRMRIPLTFSVIGLLLANFVPLFGVLFLGWSVASVLLLYWLESIVIGVLNIPKIFACKAGLGEKLFTSLFFAAHFGGFCAGHLMILIEVFEVTPELEALRSFGYLWWAAISFVLSHTFSMMFNFFGKQEYKNRQPSEQMFLPYIRVFVMHFVVLFGAFGAEALGAPVFAIVLLIVIKTLIDLATHNKEHKMIEARV